MCRFCYDFYVDCGAPLWLEAFFLSQVSASMAAAVEATMSFAALRFRRVDLLFALGTRVGSLICTARCLKFVLFVGVPISFRICCDLYIDMSAMYRPRPNHLSSRCSPTSA